MRGLAKQTILEASYRDRPRNDAEVIAVLELASEDVECRGQRGC